MSTKGEDHSHEHSGIIHRLADLLHLHTHGDKSENFDIEVISSQEGIKALKISLLVLLLTSILQLAIYLPSGSVALLSDTIHNFSDALTSLPLWLALSLSRRPPNRSYTYGYGRIEDVAGVFIVLVIAASAVIAAYESILKFFRPHEVRYPLLVALAALVGFCGNELAAWIRISTGKKLGSEALIADGKHAQADGLTSLAVLLGSLGVILGFPLIDPIVGLVIAFFIIFILRDVGFKMWWRLMDAVDPSILDAIERSAGSVEGVQDVHDIRVRWLGHNLQAEMHVTVDEDLPTYASHKILEDVRHKLFHDIPRLEVVNVHADPCGHSGVDHHEHTSHHVINR